MRKFSKTNLLKIIIIVIVIALIIASFAASKNSGSEVKVHGGHKIVVGSIEDIVTAQGKIEPKEYVDVGTQVSGQLKKLYVDIGDIVKNGDVLAELDPRIYEAKVAADQARLKSLDAQLNEEKAQNMLTQKTLERNKRLFEKKAISQQVYEESQAGLQISSAKIDSIKAQLEEVNSTLQGDITNLAYTKIYAPIAGTIVSQSAKEGQTINASQTAPVIMQVANLDIMTVRTQVSEADVSKIKEDMPVYFTTLGMGQRRWVGKVRQVLPTPEIVNDVVLYNILIDVENTDRALMTGMSTQAFFVLGDAENVPVIPMEYLKIRAPEADNQSGTAYKVQLKNQSAPVIVHIGISNRVIAQVTAGLKVGDVVHMPATESAKPKAKNTGGYGSRGPQL